MAKTDTIEIPVGKYTEWAKNNPWRVSTIVLALVVLGLVVFNPLGSSANTISADKAGQQAVEFLSTNPNIQGDISLVAVERQGSFYEATVNYQGQNVPIYLTLDGNYMLPGQPIALLEPIQERNQEGETREIELGDDAVLGDINAPVTIVEFSDYQCPFCKRFWEQTLPELKEKYIETGKVKLIYKDFPLASHPQAQTAAEATECVRDLGGDTYFWLMHDKLFENQATLTEETITKYAQELGFEISTCLKDGKFTQEVQDDLQYGTQLGVSGTPGFFVNGRYVSGAQPFEVFEQIIEAELATN